MLSRIVLALVLSFGVNAALAQQAVSDDHIYDQVRLRLSANPDVNGGALTVDVKGGAVVLSGKVKNQKAKQKAEKLAKKVKGVKSVDNKLEIDPNAH